MLSNEPFPSRDIIVDVKTGKPSDRMTRWFDEVFGPRIASTPSLPEPSIVFDLETTASAGTLGGVQTSGAYHLNGYQQVITPAGVTSDLTLTIGWTFGGIAQTFSFPVMNGNLVTTHQSQDYTVQIDANTVITYSYAYNSNPVAQMAWSGFLSATLIAPLG